MDQNAALNEIKAALAATVKGASDISIETDLIEDGVLDSLDGMIFVLELQNRTGRTFPEEIDLVSEGYYKVRTLVEFLGRDA